MLNTIVEKVPSSKGAHGSVLSIYSVEPLLKLQEPYYKTSNRKFKYFAAFPDVLGIKSPMSVNVYAWKRKDDPISC